MMRSLNGARFRRFAVLLVRSARRLATSRDNAYNGVEAMRAWGADPEGRPIGGEASDYGDVLTTLSAYLRSITR
jgi:hypothetical protein